MRRAIARFCFVVGALLPAYVVGQTEENSAEQAPEHDTAAIQDQNAAPAEPSPEEIAIYGNRAEFVKWLPNGFRPDPDWRSVLAPWLADAEPKWSQAYEELLIRDFFRDVKGGVYVDIGCAWARLDSTTYYLERLLHWTGVGVDVQESFAADWEKFRPQSVFVPMAIGDADGEMLTLHIAGVIHSLDKEMAEQFLPEQLEMKEIQVETITMNTLLERHGIHKIDFLSIDIEGAEMMALAGFDIQKYKPELCCIETANREEVTRYFTQNGYEPIEEYFKADKVNLYFRRTPQDCSDQAPTASSETPAADGPESAPEAAPDAVESP